MAMMQDFRRRLTLSTRFSLLIFGATLAFGISGAYLQQRSLYREKQAATRHAVEVAYGVMAFYGQQAESGMMTDEDAQQAAAAAIKSLRYEKTDYFWINDTKPRVIMHPINAALVGQDVSTFADPNGKLIYIEAVKVARNEGGGHFEYMWPKPGETEPKPKLSYVKLYPRWNWVIGSGIHIEDVRAELWSLMATFLGVALVVMAVAMWLATGAVRTVRQTTTALSAGATQVMAAAGQVAAAAQSLSQGASEQAASLEETSASTEELAATTRQNAERSRQSAELVRAVDRSVGQANEALTSMAGSMSAIHDSSAQVSKIVKTIDEIAFQTNILALNAAVEAARAGEAGMGFAVVADEVRNLAQRASQAAKDTALLIEQSIANTSQGRQDVQQVVSSVTTITRGVDKVKSLVEEVSSSTRQQAHGIDSVAEAVARISKVTQMTAATAEESAAASEELNAQAESAMDEVRRLDALVSGHGGSHEPLTAPTADMFAPMP